MVLKKVNNSQILCESIKTKAYVDINDENLQVSVETSLNKVDISKPGEYEYEEIGVTALELTNGKFELKVNLVKLSIEGITIGIVSKDLPMDKEAYKDLGNLDILVIKDNTDPEFSKKLINYFDVLNVVFLSDSDLEATKQKLGLASIIQDKSLKIKATDIRREENSLVNGFVI